MVERLFAISVTLEMFEVYKHLRELVQMPVNQLPESPRAVPGAPTPANLIEVPQ